MNSDVIILRLKWYLQSVLEDHPETSTGPECSDMGMPQYAQVTPLLCELRWFSVCFQVPGMKPYRVWGLVNWDTTCMIWQAGMFHIPLIKQCHLLGFQKELSSFPFFSSELVIFAIFFCFMFSYFNFFKLFFYTINRWGSGGIWMKLVNA